MRGIEVRWGMVALALAGAGCNPGGAAATTEGATGSTGSTGSTGAPTTGVTDGGSGSGSASEGTGVTGGTTQGGCVPSTEVCDGIDDDCDGVPDDGPCSTPAPLWDRVFGDQGADFARGVVFDAQGNVYLTGGQEGGADLGDGPIDPAIGGGFVASYGPDGAFRWKTLFSGSAGSWGQDLAIAPNGDVVVVGAFAGTIDFGGGPHTASGNSDAFVLRLDAGGAFVAERVFGGAEADWTRGVAIDAGGDVVVAGFYGGSADFGGGMRPGAGNADAFVARYAADGTYKWDHTYVGAGHQDGEAIAVDAAGNVLVVGSSTDPLDFGGGERPFGMNYPPYILALAPDGSYRWDHVFEGVSLGWFGVETQSDGTVVVAGSVSGVLDIGGPQVGGPTTSDLVVAGFAPDGAFEWQFTLGGKGGIGYDVAVGADDTIVVGGNWSETVTFGDEERTAVGMSDIFAVGLTAGGEYLWHQTFGGTEVDAVNAVAVGPGGAVAVAGEVQGPIDLGHGERPIGGFIDGYVVALQ